MSPGRGKQNRGAFPFACTLCKAPHIRDNSAMKNLFTDIPVALPTEFFDTLVDTPSVCIQRIISNGHTTPEDDWYDQDKNEFVVLLKGAATLEFEEGRVVSLAPGSWLEIPAHEKHRVAWTDENSETVWLAVHYT